MAVSPIAERGDVTRAQFEHEVVSPNRPVVLRGAVGNWPATRLGSQSAQAICRYLVERDSGAPVDAILLPPQEHRRIFYNAAMDGFNFLRQRMPLSRVIEQIARYSHFASAPAVAVQSALIRECLPRFLDDNRLALLDAVEPRIWIGTAIVTPAHYDNSRNIACVVAGHRRFTLFPPEQIDNLHVGPFDFAPAGPAISLVDFAKPDFVRFPRFRAALEHALVAELGPGDAIYMPARWWHHVESLDACNVLVNYWWADSPRPHQQ